MISPRALRTTTFRSKQFRNTQFGKYGWRLAQNAVLSIPMMQGTARSAATERLYQSKRHHRVATPINPLPTV
jgi:hypothetical protein